MSIEEEIKEFEAWLSAWFQPDNDEGFSKSSQDILKRLRSCLELREAWVISQKARANHEVLPSANKNLAEFLRKSNKDLKEALNDNKMLRIHYVSQDKCIEFLRHKLDTSNKEKIRLNKVIRGLSLERRILQAKLYKAIVTSKIKGKGLFIFKRDNKFVLGFGTSLINCKDIAVHQDFRIIMDLSGHSYLFSSKALGENIGLTLSPDCIKWCSS